MMEGGGANKGGAAAGRVSWDIWPIGNNNDLHWSSNTSPPPVLFPFSGEPHHHLTCLKLGKRQYYEEPLAVVGPKKEKSTIGAPASSPPSSSSSATVPRCQVEGCNVALSEAKEYHKRHKVCDAHSKSPKVVVLGLVQRFCQQCSRFHVLSEFDDAKRSCRRRLAGHNERRRKSSNETIMRNPQLDYTVGMGGRFPYIPSTSPGRALSLLSSDAPSRWVSPDLSYRSSAALRELIAENRAALFSHQLSSERDMGISSQGCLSYLSHQHSVPMLMPGQLPNGWEQFRDDGSAHVTLDLLQVQSSPYELLSVRRGKNRDDDECCDIWKSLEETHAV